MLQKAVIPQSAVECVRKFNTILLVGLCPLKQRLPRQCTKIYCIKTEMKPKKLSKMSNPSIVLTFTLFVCEPRPLLRDKSSNEHGHVLRFYLVHLARELKQFPPEIFH